MAPWPVLSMALLAQPSSSTAEFDLVVLGAGSGGYACALRAAQLGFRRDWWSRTRSEVPACTGVAFPTKAMLHAAEVADSVRNGSQFGIHAAIDKIDLAGVVSYADSVVDAHLQGLVRADQLSRHHRCARCGPADQADGRPAVMVGEETHPGAQSGAGHRVVPTLAAGLEVDGRRSSTASTRSDLTDCQPRRSCSAAG